MKLLKIAVGTTSETKLSCLKEVLADIGVKAKLVPTEVESGIAEQPVSEEETRQGAIGRAKGALKANPDSDFGLGIEVGYHPNKQGDYEMFCCASIVGKNNFSQTCLSSRFLLPSFHQNILKKGKYLGEYVRKYQEGVSEPVANYIRELVRGRRPLIMEATRNALLIYLEKNKSAEFVKGVTGTSAILNDGKFQVAFMGRLILLLTFFIIFCKNNFRKQYF